MSEALSGSCANAVMLAEMRWIGLTIMKKSVRKTSVAVMSEIASEMSRTLRE